MAAFEEGVAEAISKLNLEMLSSELMLRDLFALQALRMFTINDQEVVKLVNGTQHPQHGLVAKFCYDLADSMMKERAKKFAPKAEDQVNG